MTGTPRARTATLRREWETVHPRLRTTVVAMLSAGTVLTALGAAGDAAGAWSRFPFLTNLASALTGALFGLPVALLVVQRLIQAQTQTTERAAAWRLALRSAHTMRFAARTLLSAGTEHAATDLDGLLAQCDGALAEAREWADRAAAAKARPRRLRASMYQRTYLHQVLNVHRQAQQALDVVAATGIGTEAATAALERIRTEAAFLHDDVRPMLLRLDGRWLAAPQARALERADDTFPADLAYAAARQLTVISGLIEAIPAAQLATLLPETDAARDQLTDPDLPLPMPAIEHLEELRAELGRLQARLATARQAAEAVEAIHDEVDRLAV
ncbi:hypothetical protein AB0F81_34115 [Actinoplanes sp. NPDC024001]|uniref:hypothetical protein n=1 Tax=Actinoplanes sp. NPDC024001 TaxID=3154598 RepID=UPI0033C0DA76